MAIGTAYRTTLTTQQLIPLTKAMKYYEITTGIDDLEPSIYAAYASESETDILDFLNWLCSDRDDLYVEKLNMSEEEVQEYIGDIENIEILDRDENNEIGIKIYG